jgi:drug/metabolite transporter (DMT)-like permease
MRHLLSRRKLIDLLLLIAVNTMWAAQYAAYKTATGQMGPVTVSCWTFLIASLALAPFLLRERRSRGLCRKARPQRGWLDFLLIATLGLVPASAVLAWGTDLSTASNAALLYLTVPIITALMASAMLGERMTPVRWFSLVLSLAGATVLSGFDWRHAALSNVKYLAGNLLVLLACASSAFYNVYSKKLLRSFTPLEVLIYGYLLAIAVSIPLLIWVEPVSAEAVGAYRGATWVSVLVLSIFSWGLAMVLWMFLLERLDVSQISISIYLLPLLGVLIASVTLGEKITGSMMIGGALTLAGTVLITVQEAGEAS